MSNRSSGNVRHLDTISFTGTISAYQNHIQRFNSIVTDVDRTLDTLLGSWQGEGRNAFETDTRQIRRDLIDMTEAMECLRDLLNAAHEEYLASDRELSQGFRNTDGG